MKHSPGFIRISEEARAKVRELGPGDVKRKLDAGEKFHFVDVREDDEWRAGRAKSAIHIGKGVIERDIEVKLPDKSAEIVLYCGGGYRSALAADVLQRMGYTNVASMDGGIKAWRASGFPEESDK